MANKDIKREGKDFFHQPSVLLCDLIFHFKRAEFHVQVQTIGRHPYI